LIPADLWQELADHVELKQELKGARLRLGHIVWLTLSISGGAQRRQLHAGVIRLHTAPCTPTAFPRPIGSEFHTFDRKYLFTGSATVLSSIGIVRSLQ
jgi:hypothetical protein